MAIGAVAAGVSGLIGVGKSILGARRAKKARERLDKMKAPDYRDSEAFDSAKRNLGTARRFMEGGLPDEITQSFEQATDRATSAALNRMGRIGGSVGAVSRASTDAYTKLAEMEGSFQLKQRGAFMQAQENLRGAQDKAYDIDLGEFKVDQSIALGEMNQGRETLDSGLQDIFSGIALGIEGGLFDDDGFEFDKDSFGDTNTLRLASSEDGDTIAIGSDLIPEDGFNQGNWWE